MGPFYCPNDQQGLSRHRRSSATSRRASTAARGKACEFSEAYVIAHEVGHHVQNLLGILPKVQQRAARRRQQGGRPTACRCASSCRPTASPASGPTTPTQQWKFLEPGDVDAALQTASAIGDDTLQRTGARATWCRTASPTARRSSASAGSSTGFKEGKVSACNTFAAAQLIMDAAMPGIDDNATLRAAQDRGADGVRHARARRRQVGRDAGRADREGRPRGRRARHRHRRRREDPRAGARPGSPTRPSTSSSRPAAPASPAAT